MNQLISIIIPAYNRAHVIGETLASIIAQTYKNWECIIIDDGSTDNTLGTIKRAIKEDSRFILFERPDFVAKGASGCRNYGVEKSKGQRIQFFDSDDIMHPQHLELKEAALNNFDFVTCKVHMFTGSVSIKDFQYESESNLIFPDNPFKAFVMDEFPLCMVAPLWNKNSLVPYLPLRQDLKMLIDRELHTRILFDNPNFNIVNKTLIYYRQDLPSINYAFKRNTEKGISSILKALSTALELSSDKEIRLHILKKVLGYFRKALAERNSRAAKQCLDFCDLNNLWFSPILKLKRFRVFFFFNLFKIFNRGDTKFKFLFKI